jgi:hypothetical protein
VSGPLAIFWTGKICITNRGLPSFCSIQNIPDLYPVQEKGSLAGKLVHLRTESSRLVAGAVGHKTYSVEGLVEDVGFAEGNFGFERGHAAEGRRLAEKDGAKDGGLALDDRLEARCLGRYQAGNQHSRCRTTLL